MTAHPCRWPRARAAARARAYLGAHLVHLLWLAVALAFLAGCASPPRAPADAATASRQAQVAALIRANYEEALPRLPQNQQRHYAQRLYRITGDARYLPINQAHGQRLLREISAEADALDTPGHVARRVRELLASYPVRTEKQRSRKRMLAQWGPMLYAQNLVFQLVQAKSLGLLNAADLPNHQRALDYLAGVDFRRFLFDRDVMANYAAQVANLSYYLHDLGIMDVRRDVIAAFRQQYPPQRDAMLSTAEYRNKIYGMTHFVIAASDYYQKPVSAREFGWVLDEFAASVDQIRARATADIMAEVGISFLLAGATEHPAVARMREAIVSAYDPATRMIPSEEGDTDLARGEHRNVLAIMLLTWPGQLHPGPLLHGPAASARVAPEAVLGPSDRARRLPAQGRLVAAAASRTASGGPDALTW